MINGLSATIKGLQQVETYYETWNESGNAVHRHWVLLRIPKKKDFHDPPGKFEPVWRSVILPGWGQFYKGQSTKGYFLLISEALLIPSGIIFLNLKNTAEVDAAGSRTQALKDYYTDQGNLYYNIGISALIAAGAVYIYNLFDVIMSEGERVYVYDDRGVKMIPLIGHNNGVVVSAQLKIRF
jgi:hypothetical protein